MRKSVASQLLSVPEVAKLKDVTSSAVYQAIRDGRLPGVLVLGKIGVRQRDAELWMPISYRGRPGAKGRRKAGTPMTEEAKRKLSESQKERWVRKRGA